MGKNPEKSKAMEYFEKFNLVSLGIAAVAFAFGASAVGGAFLFDYVSGETVGKSAMKTAESKWNKLTGKAK